MLELEHTFFCPFEGSPRVTTMWIRSKQSNDGDASGLLEMLSYPLFTPLSYSLALVCSLVSGSVSRSSSGSIWRLA
jgi:hypothetical protein